MLWRCKRKMRASNKLSPQYASRMHNQSVVPANYKLFFTEFNNVIKFSDLHKFQPCLAQNECLHDSLRRMQCRQPSQKRPLNLVRMYITKARMLIILEINKANVNTKVDGRKQGAQAPVQIDTNARIWLLIIRNNVN